MTFGENSKSVGKMVNFLVVDCSLAYNAFLGRPTLHELKAIPSAYRQVMKFPTPNGVGMIRGEQKASKRMLSEETRMVAITMDVRQWEAEADPCNREFLSFSLYFCFVMIGVFSVSSHTHSFFFTQWKLKFLENMQLFAGLQPSEESILKLFFCLWS